MGKKGRTMRMNHSMYGSRQATIAALCAIVSVAFPFKLLGQATSSEQKQIRQDLGAETSVFTNYSSDFKSMGKNLTGDEYWLTVDLTTTADSTVQMLFASNTMLQMYDEVQCTCKACEEDRALVKDHFVTALKVYSFQLDYSIDRNTQETTFAKTPAVADLALKMTGDLRTAKQRVDAVLAALR